LKADLPFSSIQAEVLSQVRYRLQVERNHHVNRATLARWYRLRDQIAIDSQIAEFCFLSACHERGCPMYWASRVNRKQLKECIARELQKDAYPIREVLSYVVAAFFWKERNTMLAGYKSEGKQANELAERLLLAQDQNSYISTCQFQGMTFKFNRQVRNLRKISSNAETAQKMFDELLDTKDTNLRTALNQLDISLHAERQPRIKKAAVIS
jgi:hypothetical protein